MRHSESYLDATDIIAPRPPVWPYSYVSVDHALSGRYGRCHSSHLAVTAHWISQDETSCRLTLKASLIGFQHINDPHTGANIVASLMVILDHADITLKVSLFAHSSYAKA